MKRYIDVLEKCPLFYGIDYKDLATMLSCLDAKIEFYDKKCTIFAEGSPAKYIGVILSGTAQIIQIDYNGNRNILTNINPSEMFAEAFACAGVSSLPVAVIAHEPCEVMLIDCNHILNICTTSCGFHHQLIFNLMKELASKAILFQQKIEVTSKRSTREKLMTYLMIYSRKVNSNSFDIPFDRQELADYLEVDRSGLSVEISKLKKEGVIENCRGHFEIL